MTLVHKSAEPVKLSRSKHLRPGGGFDVALPGVTLGRDVARVRAQRAYGGGQALLVLIFEKLTTVVGLPDQAAEIDPVTGQMDGELFGQEGGITLGQLIRRSR